MSEVRKAAALSRVGKIRAEIEARRAELEAVLEASGQRIGKISVATGLAELDLSDKVLRDAFRELVARFQESSASTGGSKAAARAASSHD